MSNEPRTPDEVLSRDDFSPIVEQLNRSEIDMQIATAKKYPRSIKVFQDNAKALATSSEQVASECFYTLPRGGKNLEGPSARLAEIVMSCWGNCRGGVRSLGEDDKNVILQGVFHDLERNIAVTTEVRRRITTKQHVRFNDDMVTMATNAGCSIALRNAVFKGIPKAFWQPIYEAARRCAIGDVQTLAARRDSMLAYFAKMGVSVEQILQLLERAAVDDIDGENLATLKGLATAIKDGDTTIEQVFKAEKQGEKHQSKEVSDLSDQIAAAAGEQSDDVGSGSDDMPPDADEFDDDKLKGDDR